MARGRTGASACAILCALALAATLAPPPSDARAQDAGVLPGGIGKTVPDGTPLLLEADILTYDRDARTVTASGGVQIAYGPYRLVAGQVSYNQETGRLVARDRVEIVEPDGNRVYADEIDVTDDFAEGFVNGLRIETAGNTRFAAESAVRGDAGQVTVFNNGVYTACEVCADDPDKPLTWRVRARRVIWNQVEREITFDGASFEFFGQPLFAVPAFTIPDHTVKRQSGFLAPSLDASEELGVGLTVPYYLALHPTYDATIQGTLYTRQGLLAEGQFRKRFRTGSLEVRAAGIAQADPGAFLAGTPDDASTRAMIGTRGDFRINERWQWGFDGLFQTDRTFASTYDIAGYDAPTFVNNVYLVGLDDRSYFEIKAEEFLVQSAEVSFENENPVIYPSLDYERTLDTTLLGGEISIDVSAVNLTRDGQSCRANVLDPLATDGYRESDLCLPLTPIVSTLGVRETGIDGDYARLSAEVEWSGLLATPGGLVFEPLAAGRMDAVGIDAHRARALGQIALDGEGTRTMATLGGTLRYPVVAETAGGSHVFEPVAQLFVRPDEGREGGIVNEDSQSLVFDASTLLERDKFSGDDRIEGGTRLNLAMRYAAQLRGGLAIDAVAGQSFHLAGENPFARPAQRLDLVNTGAQSGLETDRSDYVGAISVSAPIGLDVAAGARIDESELTLRAADVEATYSGIDFSVLGRYAFVDEQPDAGNPVARHQLQGAGRLRIGEHWAVSANATYDIQAQSIYRRGIGLQYADECFAYTLDYQENLRNLDAIDRSLEFKVSLRTIGDFGANRALAANN